MKNDENALSTGFLLIHQYHFMLEYVMGLLRYLLSLHEY